MIKPHEIDLAQGLLEEDVFELYENAPCAFLSLLPDGTIIKANRTFLHWTGYAMADVTWERRFQDLLPVAAKIYYDTHIAPLLLMQGQVKEIACDVICSDGERLPVFFNASLKKDRQGKPLIIRTTLVDARQRRAYEQEILIAKRKLEETEAELRRMNATLEKRVEEQTAEKNRLWRTAQDILAIGSIDGRFISCNPAFTRVLGWTQAEIQSTSFVDMVFANNLDTFSESMAKLEQGEPILQNLVRRRHKSGDYKWISWNIVPEDSLLYFIGRDVTPEIEQKEALRAAEEALLHAQKMEAIGHLTGGIAHDFNNLLAGIIGNLQLMRIRMEQGNHDLIPQYVDAAEAVADKAVTITHRLLTYARRQTLVLRLVEINDTILSMKDLCLQAVGPQIQLDLSLSAEPHNVHIDKNQFENALLNLVINARDAIPERGQITIRTEDAVFDAGIELPRQNIKPGKYVKISVCDTGFGMTAEVIGRIFEPFFTTKAEGQGTGLGLPMVWGFVQQAAGYIDIQSIPGKGTTASIYLPLHDGAALQEVPTGKKETFIRAVRNVPILLVDDDEPLRAITSEFLKEAGYQVFQAADAEEALNILHLEKKLELLITDVGLPGQMNGKQLADEARLLNPELKIIFISGYVQDLEARDAFLISDMPILTKPFSFDKLLQVAFNVMEENTSSAAT